jgi:hypothetical protein
MNSRLSSLLVYCTLQSDAFNFLLIRNSILPVLHVSRLPFGSLEAEVSIAEKTTVTMER